MGIACGRPTWGKGGDPFARVGSRRNEPTSGGGGFVCVGLALVQERSADRQAATLRPAGQRAGDAKPDAGGIGAVIAAHTTGIS